MTDKWDQIKRCAERFTKEAATVIRESLHNELHVETKSDANDLVTEMDREIERYFDKKIKDEFPNHLVLGEEETGKDLKVLDGIVWIIDPIDGTMNFVHQKRNFAISVGIYEDGIGMIGLIYDVMADELYYGYKGEGAFVNGEKLPMLQEVQVQEAVIAVNSGWLLKDERLSQTLRQCRGTRSYGSAALEIANVAANRLDGYVSLNLSPWDFAAGLVILTEVGGRISTLTGEDVDMFDSGTILVGKNNLHQSILNSYNN